MQGAVVVTCILGEWSQEIAGSGTLKQQLGPTWIDLTWCDRLQYYLTVVRALLFHCYGILKLARLVLVQGTCLGFIWDDLPAHHETQSVHLELHKSINTTISDGNMQRNGLNPLDILRPPLFKRLAPNVQARGDRKMTMTRVPYNLIFNQARRYQQMLSRLRRYGCWGLDAEFLNSQDSWRIPIWAFGRVKCWVQLGKAVKRLLICHQGWTYHLCLVDMAWPGSRRGKIWQAMASSSKIWQDIRGQWMQWGMLSFSFTMFPVWRQMVSPSSSPSSRSSTHASPHHMSSPVSEAILQKSVDMTAIPLLKVTLSPVFVHEFMV